MNLNQEEVEELINIFIKDFLLNDEAWYFDYSTEKYAYYHLGCFSQLKKRVRFGTRTTYFIDKEDV